MEERIEKAKTGEVVRLLKEIALTAKEGRDEVVKTGDEFAAIPYYERVLELSERIKRITQGEG